MRTIRLGPWAAGMDNVTPEPRKPGSLTDAVNVDFDREGNALRRPGPVSLATGDVHSLGNAGGQAFCMIGSQLCRISWPWATEVIGDMPTADPASYTTFDGRAVIANRSAIVTVLDDGTVADLAPPNAPTFTLSAGAAGGLDAGRYGVAISTQSPRGEGPLGPILFAAVDAGGGITISGLSVPAGGTGLTIYRTGANGDVLYAAASVPASMSQFLLGSGQLGRDCPVRHTRQMPPGDIVRSWRGRIVTAAGKHLRFSLPMRPGLTDLRYGWVTMPNRITMVEPVEGGLWVGTTAGVHWLPGNAPEELRIVRTTALPPVPGASMVVQTDSLPDALGLGALPVAVWLSASGFCIGGPDGRLIQPQSKRIQLVPGQAGGLTYVQASRRFAALSA